jgi:hypothetical protein
VSREILIAAIVTLIVDEATGLSRWSAAKLARWAAKHIYGTDIERAKKRAEEWEALTTKSIPTNIAALCFGLSLGAAAISCMIARKVTLIASALSPAYAALPGFRLVEQDENQLAECRGASLIVLKAANDFRLQAASVVQCTEKDLDTHLALIRSLALETQLKATNSALLAPRALADPVERLAEAAIRLVEAAENNRSKGELPRETLDFTEFDESIKCFRQSAVALSLGQSHAKYRSHLRLDPRARSKR